MVENNRGGFHPSGPLHLLNSMLAFDANMNPTQFAKSCCMYLASS